MKPRSLEPRLHQQPSAADDVLARAVRAALAGDPESARLSRLAARLDVALERGSSAACMDSAAATSDVRLSRARPRWFVSLWVLGAALCLMPGAGSREPAARVTRLTPIKVHAPVQASARMTAAASAPVIEPTEPAAVLTPVVLTPKARPRVRPVDPHTPMPSETRSELELLRAAQQALPDAGGHALELTQAHQRTYPHGTLEQERELLAIEALLALHEPEAARVRAAGFGVAFPRSVHVRRLQRLFERAGFVAPPLGIAAGH